MGPVAVVNDMVSNLLPEPPGEVWFSDDCVVEGNDIGPGFDPGPKLRPASRTPFRYPAGFSRLTTVHLDTNCSSATPCWVSLGRRYR